MATYIPTGDLNNSLRRPRVRPIPHVESPKISKTMTGCWICQTLRSQLEGTRTGKKALLLSQHDHDRFPFFGKKLVLTKLETAIAELKAAQPQGRKYADLQVCKQFEQKIKLYLHWDERLSHNSVLFQLSYLRPARAQISLNCKFWPMIQVVPQPSPDLFVPCLFLRPLGFFFFSHTQLAICISMAFFPLPPPHSSLVFRFRLLNLG